MTVNMLQFGPLLVATVRDSYTSAYRGGITERSVASGGSTVAQRNPYQEDTIQVGLKALNDADTLILSTLLQQTRVVPIVLPSGVTFASRIMPDVSRSGWIENATDEYSVSLKRDDRILLADTPWRGTQPGLFAFSKGGSPAYSFKGWPSAFTLVDGVGWTLRNVSGTYGGVMMYEKLAVGNRSHVLGWFDVSVSSNTSAAVGLSQLTESRDTRPLGATGVAVEWANGTLRILDSTNAIVTSTTYNNASTQRFTVLWTAGGRTARCEVFQGRTRVLYAHSIKWDATIIPVLTASSRTNNLTLHHWHITEI